MLKAARVIVLIGLSSLLVAAKQGNFLDEIEGHYEVPATSCSMYKGDKLVECDPIPNDCLAITKVDESHASIAIGSIQANGHSCSIRGIAEMVGRTLQYFPVNRDGSKKPNGIEIYLERRKLLFRQIPEGSGTPGMFCGTRANIESIEFPIGEKTPPYDCQLPNE
jgi:hypothetical protein